MINEVLTVGPYSLIFFKMKGSPASGKYAMRYRPTDMSVAQYLWKDGEFRVVSTLPDDPLAGWFDSMEDILATLEAAFPGVGEVVG